MIALHHRRFDDLDVGTLYDLLRLRAEVFVVEQECPYLDPDGLDRDPGTVHWWASEGPDLVSTLRWVPVDLDGERVGRIGRVVTRPSHRSTGVARRLMDAVLGVTIGPVVIDAQSHLTHWYGRSGFEVSGVEFLEDGIPHTPMRLQRPGAARHP